jgi:heme-degrading monooxygenase HmoA
LTQAEFAQTPEPPYYAVIFTSLLKQSDDGYAAMASRMEELASQQEGCLGAESARNSNGFGVTISYFKSEAAILAWKQHAEHILAQELGKALWYSHYELRIARVERAYRGPQGR